MRSASLLITGVSYESTGLGSCLDVQAARSVASTFIPHVVLKAALAASTAASTSLVDAWETLAMGLPVAGLNVGKVLWVEDGTH